MVVRAALALVLCLGCAGRESATNPEGAVRLLIAAARSGDRARVHDRLGPATRSRLETLRSTARTMSGRLELAPPDFLAAGWARAAWEPADVRTLRRSESAAEVEVFSAAGDRHAVTVVREGAEWKVELPGL